MVHDHLIHAIERRTATLTVVGQGYVGLPLAVAFAEAGFAVRGFETDLDRVGQLNEGSSSTSPTWPAGRSSSSTPRPDGPIAC